MCKLKPPAYGVTVVEDFLFVCTGPQGHAGADTTREGAMVDYANRKVMTEDEFYGSGCLMVG